MAARIDTFDRDEWLTQRWTLADGEAVTIVGPNGTGKTHLALEIIDRHATVKHPAVILVKKPRDRLIKQRAEQMGLDVVSDWPPTMQWLRRKPRGYVVWPKTAYDPDIDLPRKSEVFRRTLLDLYRKGHTDIFVDDAFGMAQRLKLADIMIELWTEYRSMGGNFMTAFQRPSHVPLWAYNEAHHLLLFNSPDKRARERYAEFGGIDPKLIEETVRGLGQHEFLYIRRRGPAACIVRA